MADMKETKKTIKELSKLLGENNLTEIEVEHKGVRIRVSRGAGVAAPAVAAPPPVANEGAPEAEAGKPAKDDPSSHPGCVKSPMVGTVFTAPEPGADPFVIVGDTVKKGQILLIVEAMKVMNPITAPRGGKITAILIENSQPIEFDEPLLVIE